MEMLLRAALLNWLASSSTLATTLSSITEETPARTILPWLSLSASAAIDWSTKTEVGEEVRIALNLQCQSDQADGCAALVSAIDAQVRSMPPAQTGFVITSILFMRSRVEQRSPLVRAVLLEYRFRIQAA